MRGDGEPAERLYGKGGGDGRGMDVLLKWLWGWSRLMQREGQAHSPTKREWDSADAKPYKHTHTRRPTKSERDSADAKQAERS